MLFFLIKIIDILTRLFILLMFVHVILTYFMSPFHPVRYRIDRFVEPLLSPIRRVIPTVGMFDFSPLVLILLAQVFALILKFILYSIF